jgi:hypothetical protein
VSHYHYNAIAALVGVYPAEDLRALEVFFEEQEETGDYDNMDNVRVARSADVVQCGVYWAAENDGCCGSFDDVFTAPSGAKYLVGFNYGH